MLTGDGEILVLTTISDPGHAEKFARGLVERKLAACVNCLPGALSLYHWEKEGITRDTELVLLIKTHRDRLNDIDRYFEEEHPYEVPEFIVFEIAQLSKSYRDWMRGEISLL